jgi:hypothetical protein
LAIVIALFSWVRANITFSREAEDDFFRIHVRALFGVFRYEFLLPVIAIDGMNRGISLQKKTKTNMNNSSSEQHIKVDRKDIVQRYEKARKLITHVFGFHRWLVNTLERTHCSEIRWITNIGLDDAAETAITTGIVWGLKTSVLSFVLNHIKLEDQPQLSVVPHFNIPQFNTFFRCIIMVRLGYAMLAGLHLLVRILKVKGGIKTWQNILFKA